MVDIDSRIEFTGKNLDKIQKQVEECNPAQIEQNLGWIPEQNLLYNYGIASIQLNGLRKDLDSTQPGIFTNKREKENYNFREKQYLDLRSRYEKLGKDFAKNCICKKSSE